MMSRLMTRGLFYRLMDHGCLSVWDSKGTLFGSSSLSLNSYMLDSNESLN